MNVLPLEELLPLLVHSGLHFVGSAVRADHHMRSLRALLVAQLRVNPLERLEKEREQVKVSRAACEMSSLFRRTSASDSEFLFISRCLATSTGSSSTHTSSTTSVITDREKGTRHVLVFRLHENEVATISMKRQGKVVDDGLAFSRPTGGHSARGYKRPSEPSSKTQSLRSGQMHVSCDRL